MWDGFSDELQAGTHHLDQCLLQFAEFSLAQEQLTKWLKGVEKAMQQHTELKGTLQEKRAQLQVIDKLIYCFICFLYIQMGLQIGVHLYKINSALFLYTEPQNNASRNHISSAVS